MFFAKLICLSLVGQGRISGTIVDENGDPISFATVALYFAADSSLTKGAISSDEGTFDLINIPLGDYFVKTQFVGLKPGTSKVVLVNEKVSDVTIPAITLEKEITQLDEVVVGAQKPIVERLADRIVLNPTELISKGNNIKDLLGYAPLVQVDLEGEITVGNYGNVLILIDGREQNAQVVRDFISNSSAEEILKVEVITNPSSRYDAKYRSVINLTTKKSLEYGFNGRISTNNSKGLYYKHNPSTSLTYRFRKVVISNTTSFSHNQNYLDQRLDRIYANSSTLDNEIVDVRRSNKITFSTSIDVQSNKKNIFGFRFNTVITDVNSFSDLSSPFYSLGPAANATPDTIWQTSASRLIDKDVFDFNLNYQWVLGSMGKRMVLNVTQTFYDRRTDQDIRVNAFTPPEASPTSTERLRVVNPNNQSNFNAQLDVILPFAESEWSFGGKVSTTENENVLSQFYLDGDGLVTGVNSLDDDIYSEEIYAAYADFSKKVGKMNVNVGARTEKSNQTLRNQELSRTYFGMFPSAQLSYVFNQDINWSLSYARKIGRPGLQNLVPFRYVVDPFTIIEGNPLLEPQFANSIDSYLNISFLTLYTNYTSTTDLMSLILSVDEEAGIYRQFTGNIDRVNDFYFAIFSSNQFFKWLQSNNGLTLSGTTSQADIENVASNFTGEGFGYILNSNNSISIGNSINAQVDFNYQSPNQWNIMEVGHQWWLNTSIGRKVWQNGYVSLAVEDIFRTRVSRFVARYGLVDMSGSDYRDTRRVRVSFSYSFGSKRIRAARRIRLGNEDIKSRMDK